jgi:hypothetical protein
MFILVKHVAWRNCTACISRLINTVFFSKRKTLSIHEAFFALQKRLRNKFHEASHCDTLYYCRLHLIFLHYILTFSMGDTTNESCSGNTGKLREVYFLETSSARISNFRDITKRSQSVASKETSLNFHCCQMKVSFILYNAIESITQYKQKHSWRCLHTSYMRNKFLFSAKKNVSKNHHSDFTTQERLYHIF